MSFFTDAAAGYNAASMEPKEYQQFQSNAQDLALKKGYRDAAQAGGIEGGIGFLEHNDPEKALELKAKQEAIQTSILAQAGQHTQNEAAARTLAAQSQAFAANAYKTLLSQPAENQEAVYQQLKPILEPLTGKLPDQFDPEVAKLTIDLVERPKKEKVEEVRSQKLFEGQIDIQKELLKPQTEMAKLYNDRQRASLTGDTEQMGAITDEINAKKVQASATRLKASQDQGNTLRTEYLNGSKEYRVVRDAFGQTSNGFAAKTPAGDMSALYSMIKLYDPTANVNQGSLATVGAVKGAPKSLLDMYNAVVDGKQLNDAQRTDLMNQAKTIYDTHSAGQDKLDQQYIDLANKSGVDPTTVVIDQSPTKSPYSPEQEAQIKEMSDTDLQQMMELKRSQGKSDTELNRIRQQIDRIRQPVQQFSGVEKDLKRLSPRADNEAVKVIAANTDVLATQFGINNPQRAQAFASQLAHESAGFNAMEERISDGAANRNYGGRMGNSKAGDGSKYKGRGFIQLTGKDNYRTYGKKLGIDLVNNPELAADPDTAIKIAAAFWQDHGLNELADREDIKGITRRINGGYNGLKDRERLYKRAKNLGLFASNEA